MGEGIRCSANTFARRACVCHHTEPFSDVGGDVGQGGGGGVQVGVGRWGGAGPTGGWCATQLWWEAPGTGDGLTWAVGMGEAGGGGGRPGISKGGWGSWLPQGSGGGGGRGAWNGHLLPERGSPIVLLVPFSVAALTPAPPPRPCTNQGLTQRCRGMVPWVHPPPAQHHTTIRTGEAPSVAWRCYRSSSDLDAEAFENPGDAGDAVWAPEGRGERRAATRGRGSGPLAASTAQKPVPGPLARALGLPGEAGASPRCGDGGSASAVGVNRSGVFSGGWGGRGGFGRIFFGGGLTRSVHEYSRQFLESGGLKYPPPPLVQPPPPPQGHTPLPNNQFWYHPTKAFLRRL